MNVCVVTMYMYMYCVYYSGTLGDQHHECVCSHCTVSTTVGR